MEKKIDPMDEEYWKKRITKSIGRIGKDKLIAELQQKNLINQLNKI